MSERTVPKGNSQMLKAAERKNAQAVTRVISFTSGKGGVGKSNTVVNAAVALAREGKSVLILDADLGLANINVLLGLRPKYTLQDVLSGERLIEEIMLDGPDGVSIIPAASGVQSICSLTNEDRLMLMEAIEQVAFNFDYLLIDTQAGIGPEVMYFNSAAAEIVCIINAEPTTLTDAYALIKVLSQNYGERRLCVLANNVADEREGKGAYTRLARAAEHHLNVQLEYLGWIPADRSVNLAVSEQRAAMEVYPTGPAGWAYRRLAKQMEAGFGEYRVKGGMQFFFRKLLEVSAYGT